MFSDRKDPKRDFLLTCDTLIRSTRRLQEYMTLHQDYDEATQLLLWADKLKLLQIFLTETLHTYLLNAEPKDLTEDEKYQVHGTHVALDQACDYIIHEVQRLCKSVHRSSSQRLDLFENKSVQTFKVLTQTVLNIQAKLDALEKSQKEDINMIIDCINRIHTRIDDMEQQLVKNESEINNIDNKLCTHQNLLDETIRRLDNRINENESELVDIKTKVKNHDDNIHNLIHETSNALCTMNSRINKHKSEITQVQNESVAVHDKVNTLDGHINNLTNVLVNVNNRLNDTVDQVTKNTISIKDDITDLKDQLENLSRRVTAVDESVYYDRISNSNLTSQIETIPQLKSQLDNLVNTHTNLDCLVRDIRLELNDLKKVVDYRHDSSSDSDNSPRRVDPCIKHFRRRRFHSLRKIPKVEPVNMFGLPGESLSLPEERSLQRKLPSEVFDAINSISDNKDIAQSMAKVLDTMKIIKNNTSQMMPPMKTPPTPPPLPPTPKTLTSRFVIKGPSSIEEVKLRHVEEPKGQYDEVIRMKPITSTIRS